MNNKKTFDLEWYNHITKLNEEGKQLSDISENERDLYMNKFTCTELFYNWKGIEAVLFNQSRVNDSKPKCEIPEGIKKLYEVDENGKFTGNYNWEYIISMLECISGTNVFEMLNTEYSDYISDIFYMMPSDIGLTLENLDDPSELYEMYIAGGVCLDCPMQIRDNPKIMYALFEDAEWNDLKACFDLMSDKLKKDKTFLLRIMQLDEVRGFSSILLNIDPEVYKDDDEFKKKMLECDVCYLFEHLWDDTNHLWHEVMESISDKEFFKSCLYVDLDYIHISNSEYASKLFEEIAERISKIIENGIECEFPIGIDKDGETTTEIPEEYLNIMKEIKKSNATKTDSEIISIMKKAVRKTIGNTIEAQTELNNPETELEGDELDVN